MKKIMMIKLLDGNDDGSDDDKEEEEEDDEDESEEDKMVMRETWVLCYWRVCDKSTRLCSSPSRPTARLKHHYDLDDDHHDVDDQQVIIITIMFLIWITYTIVASWK